jgi:hypothetical protein
MSRANLWKKSVLRVELDQRARDARLGLERIERLLVPCAVTDSWLRRVLYLFSSSRYGGSPQGHRTRGPLSNRRPSRMPQIHQSWLQVCGSVYRALRLPLHPASAG